MNGDLAIAVGIEELHPVLFPNEKIRNRILRKRGVDISGQTVQILQNTCSSYCPLFELRRSANPGITGYSRL